MLDEGLYYEYELVQLRLNFMLTGKKSKDASIDGNESQELSSLEKRSRKEVALERIKAIGDIAKNKKRSKKK